MKIVSLGAYEGKNLAHNRRRVGGGGGGGGGGRKKEEEENLMNSQLFVFIHS